MKIIRYNSSNTPLIIGLVLVFISVVAVGGFFAYRFLAGSSGDDGLDDLEISTEEFAEKADMPEVETGEKPVAAVAAEERGTGSSTQPAQPSQPAEPQFQEKEVASVVSKYLNIDPQDEYKSHDTIKREVMKEFHKRTNNAYTAKGKTKVLQKVIFKYVPAEPGQTVSFYLKNAKKRPSRITGVFKRKKDYYIYVDNDVYTVFDVDESYKHLFDKALCNKLSREKVKETEAAFKKKREDAFERLRPDLEAKFYTAAGYVMDENENWVTGKVYVKNTVAQAEKMYNYVKGN